MDWINFFFLIFDWLLHIRFFFWGQNCILDQNTASFHFPIFDVYVCSYVVSLFFWVHVHMWSFYFIFGRIHMWSWMCVTFVISLWAFLLPCLLSSFPACDRYGRRTFLISCAVSKSSSTVWNFQFNHLKHVFIPKSKHFQKTWTAKIESMSCHKWLAAKHIIIMGRNPSSRLMRLLLKWLRGKKRVK